MNYMTELVESNQLLSLLESNPTSILEMKNRVFLNQLGGNASELVSFSSTYESKCKIQFTRKTKLSLDE